jgi:hypothetical protein
VPGALQGQVRHLWTHTRKLEKALIVRRNVVFVVVSKDLRCSFDESALTIIRACVGALTQGREENDKQTYLALFL